MKVGVLMLTHLGDLVTYFPLVGALVSCEQIKKPVHLIVKNPLQDIFASVSGLRVIGLRCPWVGAGRWAADFLEWIELLRYLRGQRFDLVIVTHPHMLTSLTARMTGARTVGYVDRGDRILHRGFSVPSGHVSRRANFLLDQLGIGAVDNRWSPFQPERMESGHAAVVHLLKKLHITSRTGYICVHPGAGGAAKIWPWQNFANVVAVLSTNTGAPVVLVGGHAEEGICTRIFQFLEGRCGVVNLAGALDVDQLFGVFRAARIYIGNDSGPTHVAAASGVPVFSVFGPASDPDVWRPIGALTTVCSFSDRSFYEACSVERVGSDLADFLCTLEGAPAARAVR